MLPLVRFGRLAAASNGGGGGDSSRRRLCVVVRRCRSFGTTTTTKQPDDGNGDDVPAAHQNRRGRLILLRHGQSEWNGGENKSEARFTGWANVALTELGRGQAVAAGQVLRQYLQRNHLQLDGAYVSLLDRAKDTLHLILEELNLLATLKSMHNDYVSSSHMVYPKIPVTATWRLNERHYGALVGQSKSEAEKIYSKEELKAWRYSWYEPPPPMDEATLQYWRYNYPHCQRITFIQNPLPPLEKPGYSGGESYTESPKILTPDDPLDRHWTLMEPNTYYYRGSLDPVMPASEAFGHVLRRMWPVWERHVAPQLAAGQTLLLVGHANSVKALLHVLDPAVVNPVTVHHVKIPNTTPLVYEFEQVAQQQPRTDDDLTSAPLRIKSKAYHLKVVPPRVFVDPPLHMEPRHALRGLWLERAGIPVNLLPKDKDGASTTMAMKKSLESIAANRASSRATTKHHEYHPHEAAAN